MPTEVSSPLQDIVKRLAGLRVANEATEIKARFDDATDELVVLADCSGSMGDALGNQNLSKFDHLKIALADVIVDYPRLKLVAFSWRVTPIEDPAELPEPAGSTDLAGALLLARTWKPRKTIVISDGLPDNAALAVAAAAKLTGSIDTIYCGPDAHPAVEFLRSLSKKTGGISVVWDGYRPGIANSIRGLIAAPEAPGGPGTP